MQVPPLSNFCKHVEMLWVDPISSIWHEEHIKSDDNCEPGARLCKPLVSQTSCYVRNIISSAKLGVVLLGSLKVSLWNQEWLLNPIVWILKSFLNLYFQTRVCFVAATPGQ